MKTTTDRYIDRPELNPAYFCEVCGETLTESYPDVPGYTCTQCLAANVIESGQEAG